MSIINTITDKMLDAAYLLAKKRESHIQDHGDNYTINHISHKAIREGNTIYFSENDSVKPGDIVSHVDLTSRFIITDVTLQAGRQAATLEELPEIISVHQARSTHTDAMGKTYYSVTPTNWNAIPASNPSPGVVRVPAVYTPDIGELVLLRSQYYIVKAISHDGPISVLTVEVF